MNMAPFAWSDELYKKYKPAMMRIALQFVYDYHTAEDMTHNAFAILIDKWQSGRITSDDHIESWIRTVVVNCCRSEMQRMRYHAEEPLLDDVIDPRTEDSLPFIDRLPVGLSSTEQQILCCFYEAQMTHKEIAAFYGISEEASRLKLFRARMHCKKLLQEGGQNA